MKTRGGTRKARAVLGGLVLGFAVVGAASFGAASCGPSPTGLGANDDICYLIDGQIYCFPSSGADSAQAHPRSAIP